MSNALTKAGMTKRALSVAWPAMAESFFVALAGMIDTMMVSALGPASVAAVGLTNQPKFIGLTLFFGINVAVSALVARRKGEQRQETANEILLTAVILASIACVAISILFVVFAPWMMQAAGSNEDTHALAVEYFQIIMGGTFFNVITMVINSAQRGSGNTKLSMTTNLTSSIVNILFNYLLIEGHYGFPRWEIKGAAIATVLGTAVAAGMAIFSLFRPSSYVRVSVMRKLRYSKECAKSIWHLALNTSMENISARVGFLATAMIAARLGTEAFAAHNIGMSLLGLGFSFADGMQVAAVALSGEALGAGKKDDAKKYGAICQRIGFVISLLLAAFLFFGGRWFFSLYFQEPHIIDMGEQICRYIMVIVLLQISQIIFTGCLRAAGDVRYVLVAAIVSIAGIRTLSTLLMVNVLGWGLDGVWLGILADQASRFIMVSLRFKQGKWVDLKI